MKPATPNHVVLVTGSASFLGGAICEKFALEGFWIALHYRHSKKETLELALELEKTGARAKLFQADLEKEKQASTLIQKVTKTFGRLDVLVNNASLFSPTTQPAQYDLWTKIFATNLFAPYSLARLAAPWLKKASGSVVNLTDIYGENPILKDHAAYSASKAALLNVTRTLAAELGPEIRVNGVSPGAFFIPKNYDKKRIQSLLSKSALKRKGEPHELAEAVYFMASHPFITGQVLKVDGGRFLS